MNRSISECVWRVNDSSLNCSSVIKTGRFKGYRCENSHRQPVVAICADCWVPWDLTTQLVQDVIPGGQPHKLHDNSIEVEWECHVYKSSWRDDLFLYFSLHHSSVNESPRKWHLDGGRVENSWGRFVGRHVYHAGWKPGLLLRCHQKYEGCCLYGLPNLWIMNQ